MLYQWIGTWQGGKLTAPKLTELVGSTIRSVVVGEVTTGHIVGYVKEQDIELTSAGIAIEADELTPEQLAILNEKFIPLHYFNLPDDLTIYYLRRSQHLAKIKSIDVTKPKPIIVTRTYEGLDFDIPCIVTQDIKDQFVAGKIAVGDIVIVTYCEGRYDQAIIQSKVFRSWS